VLAHGFAERRSPDDAILNVADGLREIGRTGFERDRFQGFLQGDAGFGHDAKIAQDGDHIFRLRLLLA